MKKYNSMLAVLCFTGFIGFELSKLPLSYLASLYLGSEAVAAYSVGNSLINLATLAIAIVALIAIFKPNQVLTIIACAIEIVIALLCLIAPNALIQGLSYELMIHMSVVYLRISGIIMLVVAVASIPLRLMMNQMNYRVYLLMIIGGIVLSILLPWIFTISLGMGIQGMAFSNIMQPLACLVPLVLLNSENNLTTENVSKTVVSQNSSQHTYLDEYKKKMKGE